MAAEGLADSRPAPAAAPTPTGAPQELREIWSFGLVGEPPSQVIDRSAGPTGALGRETPSDLSSAGFMCRYCHRDFPHYRYHHDQDAIAAAGLSGPVCDGCDAVHGVGHPSALWMMVCDKSGTPHPLNAGAPCSNPRRADQSITSPAPAATPAAPQATGEREP